MLQQSCYTTKLHTSVHEQINFTLKKTCFSKLFSKKYKIAKNCHKKIKIKIPKYPKPPIPSDLLQLVMHYKDKNITNFMTKKFHKVKDNVGELHTWFKVLKCI